jgi:hypothetical protein
MKKLLFSILLMVVVAGCKDNEIPGDPKLIFAITVPGGPDGFGPDTWIVLRDDANGDLIEARQLSTDTTEIFQSTKTFSNNKLAVTFFYPMNGVTANGYYNADVYRGVDVGKEWAVKGIGFPYLNQGNGKGSYTFHLTDVPTNYFAMISNEFGATGGAGYSPSLWTGFFNVTDVSKNTALVIAGALPGDLKYMWLDNLAPNGDTTVSFSSNILQSFDKTITMSFPATKNVVTDVRAYDLTKVSEYGYHLHFIPIPLQFEISDLKIGFLNKFKRYATNITTGSFTFRSDGPAPAAINYVGPDGYTTSMSGSGINGYSITASKDYVYSHTLFSYQDDYANWNFNYYAPKGTTSHYDALTPEIMSKYSIDVSKVKYSQTDFMVKGRSYENLVDSKFNPNYFTGNPQYEESFVEVH